MSTTQRNASGRWYERHHTPYAADREIVEGYASWLKQIPWQLSCTLTFAWKVSDIQASNIFDEFINRLERSLRADIAYVRGDEKRFSGCGKPASARHFHVMLTSAAPMCQTEVQALWMSMAGNRQDQAGAKVELYNPSLEGVSYLMKSIQQIDGDWQLHKLHLFLPADSSLTMCKQMRRTMRRHRDRTALFASMGPDLNAQIRTSKEESSRDYSRKSGISSPGGRGESRTRRIA